jgi:iron complex outermembrane receptor protein
MKPLLGIGAVLSMVASGVASAQQLEEVVVTAQKREQRLQDVGISVTALSGDQVRELNFRNLADVASQTPSLSVASPLGTGGNQNFTLRGVGLNDFSEHNESPVATYQDGVYQATIAGINGQLFDVDRIEVLRGPQGTLYGRNTTGGLVQFVSRQPSATPEGFVEVQGGSHEMARVEAGFGGPLTDRLQARVSMLYDHNQGWARSEVPGVKAANGNDALAGRVLVKALVGESASVLLNVHGSSNHTTGPQYKPIPSMFAADGFTQVATPANFVNPTCGNVFGLTGPGQDCFGWRDPNPNPWVASNDRQPFQKLDTNGASLTFEATLLGANFTSITAAERVKKLYGEDTDGGPFPAIEVTNPVDSKEYTQEFRLAGKGGPWVWTAGLYYYYRDIRSGSRTNLANFGFVDDDFSVHLKSKSAAAFGQLEYALSDKVTLIGGLRYSHENQTFSLLSVDHTGLTPVFLGITTDPVPDYNVFPFTGGTTADPTPYRDARKDDLVTWRAEVDWKPADDVMVYGAVARGTKSAGWNGAIDGSPLLGPSTPEQMPYAPEKLLSYEVGFKLTRPAYRLNGAVFYYDYKDFQAFTFTGLVQQIGNLPAKVKGAELEFVARPTGYLDLTLGGSVLDTEVDGVTTPVVGGTPITRKREMVLAPKFSLNSIARVHVPVTPRHELSFQLDGVYTGRQYFDLANNPIATEGGRAVLNASVTLSGNEGRWSVAVWAKNLGDRQYRLYAIPVTGLGFTQQMYGPPRWFGGTIGYRF